MHRFMILLLAFAAACQPASLADLRSEAAREMRQLTARLHEIDTRDQLQTCLPEVQRHFTRIAKLAGKVKSVKKPGEQPVASEVADALFAELARLYEMPGCRSLIESAQQEGRDYLITTLSDSCGLRERCDP